MQYSGILCCRCDALKGTPSNFLMCVLHQHSSFIIRHSSFIIHHSSFIIHHSWFIINHCMRCSQETIRISSFIIHHSSFSIHYSAFVILPSSSILYHSLFIIHHSSIFIPYSSSSFINNHPSAFIVWKLRDKIRVRKRSTSSFAVRRRFVVQVWDWRVCQKMVSTKPRANSMSSLFRFAVTQ